MVTDWGGKVAAWFGAVSVAAGTGALLVWPTWTAAKRPSREWLLVLFITLTVIAAAAFVIMLMTGPLAVWSAWRERKVQAEQVPELDRLTDLLAVAVEDQWTRVADEEGLTEHEPIPVRWRKTSRRIAEPSSTAVRSRFEPLPGLRSVTLERLESGWITDLHAVYGGLGSGRLVIAGRPGSGKSGAAVLLVLAALKHRREQATDAARRQVPVPVFFPLHGWDPDTQPVRDWLAERLRQTYPLLTGKSGARKAARLLAAGKLAVILDDLDEMHEEVRPVALRALSRQAAFRLVILTRSDEMERAASQGLLASAAAVELQPVEAEDAADYLTRVQIDPAPFGWQELARRLRRARDSPVSRALSSPLNLTLVRDTYRYEKELEELDAFLRFCDAPDRNASHISDYLLDRVVTAAYGRSPGDPPLRYNLDTARRTLGWLANQMKEDELQWWWIRSWARPPTSRIIATGLAFGVVAGIAAALAGGIPFGLTIGLTAALTFGLLFAVQDTFPTPKPPRTLRHVIRPSSVLYALPMGLAGGIPLGLATGFAAGLTAGRPAGLAAGLTFGFAGALGGELYGVLFHSGAENASSLTPRGSWRSIRLTGLALGLMGGVAGGLVFGIAYGLAGGVATGLASGLGTALAVARAIAIKKGPAVALPTALTAGSGIGLAVGLTTRPPVGIAAGLVAGLIAGPLLGLAAGLMKTSTWSATLAFVQLAARWRIPLRLMRFLEDARDRKVLRAVGPLYQFRHENLKERMADLNRQNSGLPQQTGQIT